MFNDKVIYRWSGCGATADYFGFVVLYAKPIHAYTFFWRIEHSMFDFETHWAYSHTHKQRQKPFSWWIIATNVRLKMATATVAVVFYSVFFFRSSSFKLKPKWCCAYEDLWLYKDEAHTISRLIVRCKCGNRPSWKCESENENAALLFDDNLHFAENKK